MALSSSSFPAFYVIIFLATILVTISAQNSRSDILDPQNAARAEVKVAPLVWNDTVAEFAQGYVNQSAVDCVPQPVSTDLYGVNLFVGSAGSNWTAANAADAWVQQKQYYDYDSNSCSKGQDCLQYTQVVWANSSYVGCAGVICGNGGTFIACCYSPPGNIAGERPY